MATQRPRKDKVCIYCGEGLIGKQSKFCSDSHKNLYWGGRRDIGIKALDAAAGGVGPDPDLQALWSAFLSFTKGNKEILLKVLQK